MNASPKEAFDTPRPSEISDKLCLLVVEDNEADAYLIQRALSRHPGVGRIVHAADGIEAEELIDRGEVEPDLAFIDLHMPRKNGFDLLVALACRPQRSFPMVVLTSSNGPTDGIRSRLRGAVQVINKPETAAQLAAVLTIAVDAVGSLGPPSTGRRRAPRPRLAAPSRELATLKLVKGSATQEARDLARTTAALRSAAKIALVGGWEMDFASELTSLSPELCVLLGGSPPPEMPISDALLFWLEADRPAFVQALDQVITHGGDFVFEGRTVTGDGVVKWWRLLGESDLVGGRCVALRGAAQDITKWPALLFHAGRDVTESVPPAPVPLPTGPHAASGDPNETIDAFVHRQNVERFTRNLAAEKDEGRRRHLLLLLAEERVRTLRLSARRLDLN